jgi:hypothetical protein
VVRVNRLGRIVGGIGVALFFIVGGVRSCGLQPGTVQASLLFPSGTDQNGASALVQTLVQRDCHPHHSLIASIFGIRDPMGVAVNVTAVDTAKSGTIVVDCETGKIISHIP